MEGNCFHSNMVIIKLDNNAQQREIPSQAMTVTDFGGWDVEVTYPNMSKFLTSYIQGTLY